MSQPTVPNPEHRAKGQQARVNERQESPTWLARRCSLVTRWECSPTPFRRQSTRPRGARLCGDANRQTGLHSSRINARALGEQTLHSQNGGQVLFGEQVNLAIEMGSFVRLLRHAVLSHEDETGPNIRLERGGRRQEIEKSPSRRVD